MFRRYLQMSFFFNDTATTEIYTLSLHDALPISSIASASIRGRWKQWASQNPITARLWRSSRSGETGDGDARLAVPDRKSTRLNSSHANISYAVFCLKKKILLYFVLRAHLHRL